VRRKKTAHPPPSQPPQPHCRTGTASSFLPPFCLFETLNCYLLFSPFRRYPSEEVKRTHITIPPTTNHSTPSSFNENMGKGGKWQKDSVTVPSNGKIDPSLASLFDLSVRISLNDPFRRSHIDHVSIAHYSLVRSRFHKRHPSKMLGRGKLQKMS